MRGVVVDSADSQAQAWWWADVYGVSVTTNDGWFTVEGVPGMPILTMDLVPVPEPKTVKNRIHWDVTVPREVPTSHLDVLHVPGARSVIPARKAACVPYASAVSTLAASSGLSRPGGRFVRGKTVRAWLPLAL